jgi:hypothetical protein
VDKNPSFRTVLPTDMINGYMSGGRYVGTTTLSPSCADFGFLNRPWSPKNLPGPPMGWLYFFFGFHADKGGGGGEQSRFFWYKINNRALCVQLFLVGITIFVTSSKKCDNS